MTQTRKQQAIFPDVPRNVSIGTVGKDGTINIDPAWQLFITNLIMALQVNFKPEGIVIPSQDASDITLLTDQVSVANILYDSTNNLFKGNVNGTWKTFTLT